MTLRVFVGKRSATGGGRVPTPSTKLLFQLLHQLLQALIENVVRGQQGCNPLGLFQPPPQFFSVALFIHGDTPSR
jgi:hypothetical protein